MNPHTRDKLLLQRPQVSTRALERLRTRLSELGDPPPEYDRYIRSKAWREKREQILAHYGHTCSLCGSHTDLQIHHLHYNSVGTEQMADVAVCCKRCHFKLHHAGSRRATETAPEGHGTNPPSHKDINAKSQKACG